MPKVEYSAFHSFAVPHRSLRLCGGVIAVAWLAFSGAQAQTTIYTLGTTALVVGPAAGSNSVVLAVTPATNNWTATTNAAWLHLSPANQSGTGSTNVVFSYDANAGVTRSGTLTIGNQALTVTQAGSTYVAAGQLTTLVSSGLSYPTGLAVDGQGNVYIADASNNTIKEWSAASNTVTTLVSSGLSGPGGVAVDGEGNVYIADTTNNAIKEWSAVNNTVTTLVSSNLTYPHGVAVDGAGNVYFGNNTLANGSIGINEWIAASNTVTIAGGVNCPFGVAVDMAGDIYASSPCYGILSEKYELKPHDLVFFEVATGLSSPTGLAVDGEGNVYIADIATYYFNNVVDVDLAANIVKWTAANSTTNILMSLGSAAPYGVAVDGVGNLYIADAVSQTIKELPRAFVDTADRLEGLATGNDSLSVVLPATENLLGPFAPSSDQPWLTITGITNDVVSFAFTSTPTNRTGNIHLLGQTIAITQGGPTYSLSPTALLEGPAAGLDSAVLAVLPKDTPWMATANATWLHLSLANQSGIGRTNVVFSYDANPGATRSGTLTIGGQALTVTQAGSTYVAAEVTTLVSSGLSGPGGVAVDGAGNVYIADTADGAIKEWTATNNTVTTLVPSSSGLRGPEGVAVDGAGKVYIADTGNVAIEKWTATNNTMTKLISGSWYPENVALDSLGNVYIVGLGSADFGIDSVLKWTAANSNLVTLWSENELDIGMFPPVGIAVDGAGNVYIADTLNVEKLQGEISEWTAANSNLITVVAGDNGSQGLALDSSGNLYFAHPKSNTSENSLIEEWSVASQTVTTLVSSGLRLPQGIAVDGAGNVYFSDAQNDAIEELPHAFVDASARLESLAAGNDSLPVVLPATVNLLPPFAPSSDQPWLTISGVTNGVVSFSFTANTGPARTAHITLLGQTISITQGIIGTPPAVTGVQMLGDGVCQFSFTNTPGASFTVLSTTNLSLPLNNWTVVGVATNTSPSGFQFTSQGTTNDPQRYYTIRSP
jgi:DNA-binding beta-propeller fold protein YncE